jgi:hypothetical protein
MYRRYIRDVRLYSPPIPDPYPVVKIIKCIERKWAVAITFQIFNDSNKYIWYHERNLFHALRIFDIYLAWAFKSGNTRVKLARNESSSAVHSETVDRGRLHSRSEAELRYFVCLYLVYKYFSSIYYPISWKDFVPKNYTTVAMCAEAEEFERTLIYKILGYRIYDKSLLEMISSSVAEDNRNSSVYSSKLHPQIMSCKDFPSKMENSEFIATNKTLVRDILKKYGLIENYEGPLDELYQQINSSSI